jgi:hypothetical protein
MVKKLGPWSPTPRLVSGIERLLAGNEAFRLVAPFYISVRMGGLGFMIHRADCRLCPASKDGEATPNRLPSGWLGPFATKDQAAAEAKRLGDGRVGLCRACRPEVG